MSSSNNVSSHESLEGLKSHSPTALPKSEPSTMLAQGFESPAADKPTSNPLRRSLVLRLDEERRIQSEKAETVVRQVQSATNNVFLPSDSDLIQALDLDESHHQIPRLRLRPASSHDLDDYCSICGGNTAPFQTPRQRRTVIPPQQERTSTTRSGIPYCQCHMLPTQNMEATIDDRLSFIPMTSPTHNERLIMPSRNDFQQSLQLLLDDDDDDDDSTVEGEETGRQSQSAFRTRIMLQPKSIDRCHSDPVYASGTLNTDNLNAFFISTGNDSTTRPPGLLRSSTESSAMNSPEDERKCLFPQGNFIHSIIVNEGNNTAAALSDGREQAYNDQNVDDDDNHLDDEEEYLAASLPLLPTMATPETGRPLLRGIQLAPNRKGSTEAILQDGFSFLPPLTVWNANEDDEPETQR